MPTTVKICGLIVYEDALAAAQAGADMLGFNFYKPSPRYISPEAAAPLCHRLRTELGAACPQLVGVFVNDAAAEISMTMEMVGLRFAQLSGAEPVAMLAQLKGVAYKAIQPSNKIAALDDAGSFLSQAPTDERVPSLLLDAHHSILYGGTGQEASVDVARAVKAMVPRLMLAGGLTPENVGDKVKQVQPWGVDVAGGIEAVGRQGRKDVGKMRDFIQAAKGSS
ncbi:MAG: phosphoribosylanthranilate isomerase [Thermoflexales bacterium]